MLARKTLRGRGQRIENASRLFLVDAKRYDDEGILREELESLPKTLTYKILELQRCPKRKKEFTEHTALSREDNETEICPERGVREAIEAYQKPPCKGGFMLAKDEFRYTLASFRGRFFDIFFSP